MYLRKKLTKVNLLQKDVSKITGDVADNPDVFYEIKKYSDAVGYLISPKLAQRLFDYLEEKEMLEDEKLLKSVKEAQEEFDTGKGHDLDDVLSELDE